HQQSRLPFGVSARKSTPPRQLLRSHLLPWRESPRCKDARRFPSPPLSGLTAPCLRAAVHQSACARREDTADSRASNRLRGRTPCARALRASCDAAPRRFQLSSSCYSNSPAAHPAACPHHVHAAKSGEQIGKLHLPVS